MSVRTNDAIDKTMTVELTKPDLMSLVKGTGPDHSIMEHELVKPFGSYRGGHHDHWDWHGYALDKLSEQELWDLYCICRDSWT